MVIYDVSNHTTSQPMNSALTYEEGIKIQLLEGDYGYTRNGSGRL